MADGGKEVEGYEARWDIEEEVPVEEGEDDGGQ